MEEAPGKGDSKKILYEDGEISGVFSVLCKSRNYEARDSSDKSRTAQKDKNKEKILGDYAKRWRSARRIRR